MRIPEGRRCNGKRRFASATSPATDACGTAFTANTVVVTHDQSAGSIANGGSPPPGYFVIGDGPIIGPKQ
ncbi:MAG TPA: hypothetical protein VLU06_05485 [Thermoanaerobaculia bacterium]|nr:hypothetical protein [Thermoanaerobaculia bacterium]